MERIVKGRGLGTSEVRWSLSAKCLEGGSFWFKVKHWCLLWADKSGYDSELLTTFEEDRRNFLPLLPIADEMLTRSDKLWDGRSGAVFLSTGDVSVGHENKEKIYEEVKSFLEFLLEARCSDYAFVNLVVTDSKGQRSVKWRLHVTAAEVADLAEAVLGEF